MVLVVREVSREAFEVVPLTTEVVVGPLDLALEVAGRAGWLRHEVRRVLPNTVLERGGWIANIPLVEIYTSVRDRFDATSDEAKIHYRAIAEFFDELTEEAGTRAVSLDRFGGHRSHESGAAIGPGQTARQSSLPEQDHRVSTSLEVLPQSGLLRVYWEAGDDKRRYTWRLFDRRDLTSVRYLFSFEGVGCKTLTREELGFDPSTTPISYYIEPDLEFVSRERG
jgi:hypothetical protein